MVGSGRDTGLQANYDFLHSNDPRIQSVLDTAMVNSVSIDGSWLAGSAPMSNGDDLSFIEAGKNLIGEGIKSYVGDMEALAAIGSRSVGEVVSGLTMIMTGGDVGAGRAVGEAFAYMPRTEYGQQRLQMVAEVMEPVAQGLEWTRTTLGDFGYDAGGARLGAGLSAVPDALLAFAAPQARGAFGAVGSSAYSGLKSTGRAFAPTAGRMAESFLDSQGLVFRVVPGGPNKSSFSTLPDNKIFVTPKGVAVNSDVLKLQGTSRLAGNFKGLEGTSVDEIFSRVPRDWKMVPQDRGAGVKFLDSKGYERIRLHGPSARAPLGSNSASGWTMRIMDRAGNYYDNFGNVVPYRANSGHIPILGNPALR